MNLPWKLLTVDIDGTLTQGHGWQFIAEGVGRRREYDALMEAFQRGDVSEDRHLERMLSLVSGHTVEEVLALVASTPRIQGIREANDELHAWGIRVAILSHNPPYIGRWYAEQFGFDGFAVMPGSYGSTGVLPEPVGVRADKPGGLRRLLELLQIPADRVLHVGDGAADAALFPRVGGGVAFNSRRGEVRAAADAVVDADDWAAILPIVRGLRPRSERWSSAAPGTYSAPAVRNERGVRHPAGRPSEPPDHPAPPRSGRTDGVSGRGHDGPDR